jgi:hypothetical protein
MGAHPSTVATVVGVAAVACVVLIRAQQAPGQLPLEPPRESGQSVTGAFEGWYQNPDGTFKLLVGYFNRNLKQTLDIPIGPNNRIEPGGPDQGQPTHFLPRRQWGVFTITVPKDFGDKKLTWTLVANGQATSIPLHLNPLWVVDPFKDAALGNTPPTVRFEPGGAAHRGPPSGISRSFTTGMSDLLTLTVWVTDDRIRPPEAQARLGGQGGRGGPPPPPVMVSWSKFRGAGAVTFDKEKPVVDEADGKASTTATFTAAGEYILRAQVNDSTGEGGRGFQCCWTNAHIKVTVTPGAGAAGRGQ